MNRIRTARSENLKSKPNVRAWFSKHPSALHHFNVAKAILVSHYTGSYRGFIDRLGAPEYRFNSHGDGYTTIIASIKHSNVRMVIEKQAVAKAFRSNCKIIKDRWGQPYNVIDFKITDDPQSKVQLEEFLSEPAHKLVNFNANSISTTSFESEEAAYNRAVVALRQRKSSSLPEGIRTPTAISCEVKRIRRSPEVQAWVLNQAKYCECCKAKPPFNDLDGLPYLEIHHVKHLSKHGSDTLENTVAVCPNCHKELHFGERRDELVSALYRNVRRLIKE